MCTTSSKREIAIKYLRFHKVLHDEKDDTKNDVKTTLKT